MRRHEAWIPPTKRLLRAPSTHRCDLHPQPCAPLGPLRRRPHRLGAALQPPPSPGPPIPRSSRLSGNRRATGRLPSSRRGRGGNTPDATAACPAGRPRSSGTSQAEEAAKGRQPASRPRWGRGRCYLPWARPLPAGAALLATAAATRRPGAVGPSDSSRRAPRSRPRRRRRRRPSIPAPGPYFASRASCRHSALQRTAGEAAHGWVWKINSRCFQLSSTRGILMESWQEC